MQMILDLEQENRFLSFIQKQGKLILTGFVLLTALFFLIYRLSFHHTSQVEENYVRASIEFDRFQNNILKDTTTALSALKVLNEIMDHHPELHAKYDAVIAQSLLYQSDVDSALPYIQRTLERVQKDQLPLYIDYARTTMTITHGKYEEALTGANVLYQTLLQKQLASNHLDQFGNTLFLFNLMRIATLQHLMGSHAEELATWKEFNEYIAKVDVSVFSEIKSGKLSFVNYVDSQSK